MKKKDSDFFREELKQDIISLLMNDRDSYRFIDSVLSQLIGFLNAKISSNQYDYNVFDTDDYGKDVLELRSRLIDKFLTTESLTDLKAYLKIVSDELIILRGVSKKLVAIRRIKQIYGIKQ
jgi:hypothetical protein